MIYRNAKILELARYAPMCFCCGRVNDGTVVAAYSNQLRDGKGKGIKAHDFRVAYLCNDCHMEIDQGCKLSKAERLEMWKRRIGKRLSGFFFRDVWK